MSEIPLIFNAINNFSVFPPRRPNLFQKLRSFLIHILDGYNSDIFASVDASFSEDHRAFLSSCFQTHSLRDLINLELIKALEVTSTIVQANQN